MITTHTGFGTQLVKSPPLADTANAYIAATVHVVLASESTVIASETRRLFIAVRFELRSPCADADTFRGRENRGEPRERRGVRVIGRRRVADHEGGTALVARCRELTKALHR